MSLVDMYQSNTSGFNSLVDQYKNDNSSNNSLIDKYNSSHNESLYGIGSSPLEEYQKEAFFTPNSIASVFNVRGRNYQQLSIIDKMRGIQANRLNLDTEDLSMAEIYADNFLDNRTMNGLYNVTITDTYKDKRLFNAFHGLYTDGLLTETEDTQDIGLVQKTYGELEEQNIFFTKEESDKKTECLNKNECGIYSTNQLLTKRYKKEPSSSLVFEDDGIMSSFYDKDVNTGVIFKQNETSLTSLYAKNSDPTQIFYRKETDLVSLYKNKNTEFKTNRTISQSSQLKTIWKKENTVLETKFIESIFSHSKKEEKDKPVSHETNNVNNDFLFSDKKEILFLKKEKNKKFISNLNKKTSSSFANYSPINPSSNSFEKPNNYLGLERGSMSDKALFKDSKNFEKDVKKEKEKNKKMLERVFKETKIKIELLSKEQLSNLLNKLKIKQEKAKKEKAVLKYLKIESKIKAIENYISSLKDC